MSLLEELNGIGDLFNAEGTVICREVPYHVVTWGPRHQPGGPSPISPKEITGHVDLRYGACARLMRTGERYTLCLADGRFLDFLFTNSSGEIVAKGPIRMAQH